MTLSDIQQHLEDGMDAYVAGNPASPAPAIWNVTGVTRAYSMEEFDKYSGPGACVYAYIDGGVTAEEADGSYPVQTVTLVALGVVIPNDRKALGTYAANMTDDLQRLLMVGDGTSSDVQRCITKPQFTGPVVAGKEAVCAVQAVLNYTPENI